MEAESGDLSRTRDQHAKAHVVEAAQDVPNLPHDESAVLEHLDAQVRDQDDLERSIGREADKLLVQQSKQREQQRLERTRDQRQKLQAVVRKNALEIRSPIGVTRRNKLRRDNEKLDDQIATLDKDIGEIEVRLREADQDVAKQEQEVSEGRLAGETQRDFLIRTGKITPFSKFGLSTHGEDSNTLTGALFDAEDEPDNSPIAPDGRRVHVSHRVLQRPGLDLDFSDASTVDEYESDRPPKKRRLGTARPRMPQDRASNSEYEDDLPQDDALDGYSDINMAEDSDEMPTTQGLKKRSRHRQRDRDMDTEDLRGLDDGDPNVYRARLHRWARRRRRARERAQGLLRSAQDDDDDDNLQHDIELDENEAFQPHPSEPDTVVADDYRIPGDIYPALFDYQKTGVQWLYELSTQQVGGIVGDEMGLGKTIQIISFLAGMHHSGKLAKPVIVVCPATVMKQWVNEFHTWWPALRVTILHSSGSGMINLTYESAREEALLNETWDSMRSQQPLTTAQKNAKRIIDPVLTGGGVLVTTYSGLQTYAPLLIPVDWSYAVLDEGHKIRNPNTAITIYCKELKTPNRIILSGTPMQNNLVELWSLFDFVFPMRLGTLVNFKNQFDIPIRQGGYANASNLQVQTALKCAEALKDAISPYLLQRFKIDVATDLPKKSEQVLFCKLTPLQRERYEKFLTSGELDAIMTGKRQVLYGIDIIRKICNHPDLVDHKFLSQEPGYRYGDPEKSGKMKVVGSLLQLWQKTGHKTLLFAQHKIMLDILEKFVRSMPGMNYLRMDGSTPIPQRQTMVDRFNHNADLHVFLLTTKVGGLGVNLTGADRVLIYDPDWNPSTDLQARERAWRLGQKREVSIYRLMTAGTIEEKIYHRQIFKQFLTNKVLKDPKQRQTFHLSDLHDLFSLSSEDAPTETSTLFKNAAVKLAEKLDDQADMTQAGETAAAAKPDAIDALPGISRAEQYAGEIEEQKQANMNSTTTASEARMMEGIFSKSGIHSAIEHDAVISGNSVRPKSDPVLVEKEAKRVAAEAAKELQKAGEIARAVPIGIPTWTGQYGVSGRPRETTARDAFASNRGRPVADGSGALLGGLASLPHGNGTSSRVATSSPARSVTSVSSRADTPVRGRDFGKLIRDYLSAHGGSAYTQMLIDHFNRYCTNAQSTAEFKETLKLIARLERGGRSRGRWFLKDEYKK